MHNQNTGEFLPWFNYPQIEFFNNMATQMQSWRVFEFGCGFSSLFFAKKANSVCSSETREVWVSKINKIAMDCGIANLTINLVLPHQLSRSIYNHDGGFNLIIVDSLHRAQCMLGCIDKLLPGGLLMLDNCERPNLQPAIEACKANPIFHSWRYFTGQGPGRPNEEECHSICFFKT